MAKEGRKQRCREREEIAEEEAKDKAAKEEGIADRSIKIIDLAPSFDRIACMNSFRMAKHRTFNEEFVVCASLKGRSVVCF